MKKEESKQQKYLSNLLLEELNEVFLKLNIKTMDGKMITIQQVFVTSNLFDAKIFINIYPVADIEKVLEKIKLISWEIKKYLVERIKNKVRSIPRIEFIFDDSVEHLFKMENLFQQIKTNK